MKKITSHPFKLTVCKFPDEFSCKSGSCIDVYKRCDDRKDCKDGSDEDECTLLQIPESYDKALPPELGDDIDFPNDILVQVNVLHVDIIDTVSMMVGLTVEFTLKWRDYKLNYENLQNSKSKRGTIRIIPKKEKDKIWVPLPELVHDNAIIGEIEEVDFFMLGIEVQNDPLPMDSNLWNEVLIYPGKENMLIVSQRMKLKYRCDFFLVYFPFDETSCDFYLSIRTIGNNSIKMTKNEDSIIYHGPTILNEFEIIDFWSQTRHYQTNTSFTYTIKFKRLFAQHLMTTFFQSFLLWLLAYITLFINENDFSNRFMGAVTALLVLAALLSSMENKLPTTAYFKLIDLWFNWFIVNIFLIIIIHVLIDNYSSKDQLNNEKEENFENSKFKVSQVGPPPTLFDKPKKTSQKEEIRSTGVIMNNLLKIMIPSITAIFIPVYFFLTLNH